MPPAGINYERLYRFRHRGVDQPQRQRVWDEIGRWIDDALGRPGSVLDPAAGRGEFIRAVSADERWVVDATEYDEADLPSDVKRIVGNAIEVELPPAHFE